MSRTEPPGGSRAAASVLALLLALLAADPGRAEGAARDAALEAARTMVRETIDAVLVVVRDKSLSRDQRLDRIESIAEGRFDFSTISRLILARNWRRLSAQQRDDFVTEFKRHLSLTYGQSIDSYKDERVTVEGARAERNGDVTVRTKVEGASATPVLVDYRLRDRDGAWTCIDVIIEGVSLLQNFRTQTQEIIHEVGPDGLVQRLREKNDARASAS